MERRWKSCLACLALAALAGCCCTEPQTVEYPYHQPLRSPGAKFGGLPPTVQQSIRAQVGSAEMYDIRKLNHGGQVVYEVHFRDWMHYPPLYVGADGSVLYPDLRVAVGAGEDNIGAMSGGAMGGLKFSDLPIAVANTVLEKAPTAEIAYINQVYSGGNIFYEISFRNEGRYPKMFIAEDGTMIKR